MSYLNKVSPFAGKWKPEQTLYNYKKYWKSMITENYSRLSLTYESDFLPGLSGIATQMQEFGAGRYLAGLWEDELLTELLWSARSDEKQVKRPAKWRAPTWSWASAVGAVGYDLKARFVTPPTDLVRSKAMTILDVHCELKDSNPTGEVSSAYLRASASVVPLLLQYKFRSQSDEHLIYHLELVSLPEKSSPFVPDINLGFAADGSEIVIGLRVLQQGDGIHYLILRCKDIDSETYERIGYDCIFPDTEDLTRETRYARELGHQFDEKQNQKIITIV